MYNRTIELLKEKLKENKKFCLCIDGNCGSGKTEFSKILENELHIPVVHIDYFYLPFEKRKENWKEIPGGNMDFERLKETVLEPFMHNESIKYYRFNQFEQQPAEEYIIDSTNCLIIEGSYSMHPELLKYYDYKIFLKCEKENQIQRLKEREKDHYNVFQEIWINKEIAYFKEYDIESKADIVIDTTTLF